MAPKSLLSSIKSFLVYVSIGILLGQSARSLLSHIRMPLVYNIVFVIVCTDSCCTEATTLLLSRQSTLDDLDGPDPIPKTSERARPRLRKTYSMDMSSSSADSGSIVSRCLTLACFSLNYPNHYIFWQCKMMFAFLKVKLLAYSFEAVLSCFDW